MANGVNLLDIKEASKWASNYLKRFGLLKDIDAIYKTIFTEMIDNERN